MNYEQLTGVFGTPVNNISDNGFTVNFGGYNIKGEKVGTLPLVDLTFYAVFPTDPTNDIAQLGITLESKYGKIPTSYNKGYLSVLIDYKDKDASLVRSIIDDVTAFLRGQGGQACGIPMNTGVSASSNTGNSFRRANSADRTTGSGRIYENYALGILGALVGTALGMIVWIILSVIGIISIFGGMCIAGGAFLGYLIASGDMSKVGITVSTVMVIAAVAIAEYISMGFSVMSVLDVGFFDAMDILPLFLEDSEVLGAFIKDLVIGYVFALGAEALVYFKYFKD